MKAVMKTMFQTETDAGICMSDTMEEFEKIWKAKEWDASVAFTLPLDKVEVLEVIVGDENETD